MAAVSTMILMYHELELPGRDLCRLEPGYVRYVLSASEFESQMRSLHASGLRGLSVSSALQFADPRGIGLTFDDGSETDLLLAAPILNELSFGATFYITAGFLGTPGYLSPAQLRELSSGNFEIGCHSVTHAYLTDLDDDGLHREIVSAKLQLEQIIGQPVRHFSCPGGRFDRRAAQVAQHGGYHSMATSEPRKNSPSTDRFALGRLAVMRETEPQRFQQLCRGDGLWKARLATGTRNVAQSILGNRIYDRFRGAMLRSR